ncbi:hypothetical protein F5H01DRAFT_95077 [Linnemannia elongata]|nr:hypothetical protein F5H01DRAFT_95077 [Linnemannia elongata]
MASISKQVRVLIIQPTLLISIASSIPFLFPLPPLCCHSPHPYFFFFAYYSSSISFPFLCCQRSFVLSQLPFRLFTECKYFLLFFTIDNYRASLLLLCESCMNGICKRLSSWSTKRKKMLALYFLV